MQKTMSRTCKFQAEFENVIEIDRKQMRFLALHMTFEFQGRDLSFKFFRFFIQLRSIRKTKNIM